MSSTRWRVLCACIDDHWEMFKRYLRVGRRHRVWRKNIVAGGTDVWPHLRRQSIHAVLRGRAAGPSAPLFLLVFAPVPGSSWGHQPRRRRVEEEPVFVPRRLRSLVAKTSRIEKQC